MMRNPIGEAAKDTCGQSGGKPTRFYRSEISEAPPKIKRVLQKTARSRQIINILNARRRGWQAGIRAERPQGRQATAVTEPAGGNGAVQRQWQAGGGLRSPTEGADRRELRRQSAGSDRRTDRRRLRRQSAGPTGSHQKNDGGRTVSVAHFYTGGIGRRIRFNYSAGVSAGASTSAFSVAQQLASSVQAHSSQVHSPSQAHSAGCAGAAGSTFST